VARRGRAEERRRGLVVAVDVGAGGKKRAGDVEVAALAGAAEGGVAVDVSAGGEQELNYCKMAFMRGNLKRLDEYVRC
jgi:hypothetical protein